MHKGLTRASLGVLSAALLSGSVFASGPTLSQLPTVVITDKHQKDVLTSLAGNEYDTESPTTNNLYRFTAAIDLADYVSYGNNDQTDLQTVKYLFAEYDETHTTLQTGANRTISINTNLGVETTPGFVDVSAAADNVWDDGVLDFQNESRSAAYPDSTETDVTETAQLDMYVASDDGATSAIAMKTFTVITTSDEALYNGDQLSGGSTLTALDCTDTFDSWYTQSFDSLGDFSTVPYGAGPASNTPPDGDPVVTYPDTDIFGGQVTLSTTGTSTLYINTYASTGTVAGLAPQYWAWNSWRRDYSDVGFRVSVTAGDLVMVRWQVSGDASLTPADAPKVPGMRFRLGEATTFAGGQTTDERTSFGANAFIGGPHAHRSWYYAHADGDIGFFFDVYNQFDQDGLTDPTIGQYGWEGVDNTYSISKIEVFSMDPDDLAGASVVMNQGAASVTTADSTVPPAGATSFDAATWDVTRIVQPSGAGNRPLTTNLTADALSVTLSEGDGAAHVFLDTLNYVTAQPDPATATEIVTGVTNDQLIRIDYYLSSPEGSSANNNLPTYRIGIQTDVYGETGSIATSAPWLHTWQGRAAFHQFEGSNRAQNDVGQSIAATCALESAAKRYSVFMEPSLQVSGATTLDVRPTFDVWTYPVILRSESWMTPELYLEPYKNGTININRVVVTLYDIPVGADTVADSSCP